MKRFCEQIGIAEEDIHVCSHDRPIHQSFEILGKVMEMQGDRRNEEKVKSQIFIYYYGYTIQEGQQLVLNSAGDEERYFPILTYLALISQHSCVVHISDSRDLVHDELKGVDPKDSKIPTGTGFQNYIHFKAPGNSLFDDKLKEVKPLSTYSFTKCIIDFLTSQIDENDQLTFTFDLDQRV